MTPIEKMLASIMVAASAIASGAIAFALSYQSPGDKTDSYLSTFSTKDDLVLFAKNSREYLQGLGNASGTYLTPEGAPTASFDRSYSRTNVQVAGVDELDTVKTDGEYIYVSNDTGVSIIKAYPPDQLSTVTFIDRSYLESGADDSLSIFFQGIFVLPGKLITMTFAQERSYWNDTFAHAVSSYSRWTEPWLTVSVFDIESPEHPKLLYSAGVTGWLTAARLIGDTVYLISTSYLFVWENETFVPQTVVGTTIEELPLSKIRYDPEMRDANAYTSILAVNAETFKENCISIITGYGSTLYMSTQSIFLTVQKWAGELLMDSNGFAPEDNSAWTTIYKISFNGLSMTAVASGNVKGYLYDQFSMDEYDSYLRVATTTSWVNRSNAVYVLDENLKLVGSLEGIAPGESIFSTRFVGDDLYLVTFRQVDPLFVIDLANPRDPRVVGELTMPGFSTYLHPMDRTHILGIGSENGKAKISIFDVSDPSNPIESDKWVLEDYQYSSAIYDHKEVLYDLGLGLLVVPITGVDWSSWGIGQQTINGEFVFDASPDHGLSLKGVVNLSDAYYYYGVRRALYIDDCLYTISDSTIVASRLSDLSEIGSLVYSDAMNYRIIVY